MAGYLDPYATRGLLFALNQVKSTIINVTNPLHQEKKVSFEVVSSKTELNVKIKEGRPSLQIKVKAEGRHAGQQGDGNLTTPKMSKKLEAAVARSIKSNIQLAVDQAQKDYHLDYFGFSKILYKEHISYWKKVSDNWGQVFSQLPISIEVDWNTDNSSLIREPSVAR